MIIIEEYYTNQIMRINQYVVYTSPVKIVDDFAEACKIADDYFNETGYIVAVEETNPVVYPCLLYTYPSPRDQLTSRMPSSA